MLQLQRVWMLMLLLLWAAPNLSEKYSLSSDLASSMLQQAQDLETLPNLWQLVLKYTAQSFVAANFDTFILRHWILAPKYKIFVKDYLTGEHFNLRLRTKNPDLNKFSLLAKDKMEVPAPIFSIILFWVSPFCSLFEDRFVGFLPKRSNTLWVDVFTLFPGFSLIKSCGPCILCMVRMPVLIL